MSTNKTTNSKTNNVQDVFESLKYVDSLMNKAAGLDAPESIKESFESRLKAKLVEGEYKETPEAGVEENRYTDKENNNYPTYNYNEAGDNPEATADTTADPTAATTGAPEAGTEGLPTDTTGAPEAGIEGLPTDTTGADAGAEGLPVDMTGSPDAGAEGLPVDMTGGGSPMGGGAPAADAGADATAGMPPATGDIESPEDIEALVDQLIDKDIEQTNEGSNGAEEVSDENNINTIKPTEENNIMESKFQTIEQVLAGIKAVTEGTESKDAGAETLTSKVSDAGKKVDQTKSQGDATNANIGADYKDLGDEDVTGKVSEKGSAHTTTEDFSKVSGSKKVDQTKGQGDADKANLGADYKDLGAKDLETKMKNESVLKSKALYVLAEKYLALEDEHKALKFENYKALKVNGLLALAPNLEEATKINLVKKFDECKDVKATNALYEDVVKLIKEDKKTSLSEAVGKDKSAKVIKEEKKDEKAVLTESEKRIMFLSGAKGFDDQYFNGNEII